MRATVHTMKATVSINLAYELTRRTLYIESFTAATLWIYEGFTHRSLGDNRPYSNSDESNKDDEQADEELKHGDGIDRWGNQQFSI